EVAAAHAASVEPLNEELVFYLKARGVNEKEAREMLIKGYFEYVFKLFNDINSIEILRDSLNLKWDLSL
ncbi:MAG: SufD family Fe-S cluster assembly protein, partial [Candidatus Heimdallarchaeota archaeon]